MITKDQVIDLMERLTRDKTFTHSKFNRLEMGMRLILIYLMNHQHSYALAISKDLNISRERVSVLLKKLEDKNFIQKTTSSKDARREIIEVTTKGKEFIEAEKEQRIILFTKIVEEIGYEKMCSFVNTLVEIREMFSKYEALEYKDKEIVNDKNI